MYHRFFTAVEYEDLDIKHLPELDIRVQPSLEFQDGMCMRADSCLEKSCTSKIGAHRACSDSENVIYLDPSKITTLPSNRYDEEIMIFDFDAIRDGSAQAKKNLLLHALAGAGGKRGSGGS